MLKGSCLCGKVTYTVDGPLGPISHCHCRSCRKSHAAAFATVARVNVDDFRVETGMDSLTAYDSSPAKKRYFCSNCGTPIYARKQGQDFCVLRVATLDDDPGARPVRHIFTGEKASWYTIEDHLTQHEGWPES